MPGDTPHIPCDTWNITGTDPGISQVIPGIFQVSPGICGSPQTVRVEPICSLGIVSIVKQLVPFELEPELELFK